MSEKPEKLQELADEQLEVINKFMAREPRNAQYAICSIRDMVEEGDLVLNPEYQRNYLQTDKESSKFIESVFLGCVIPEVQLFQEMDGSIEVLDGQQRITSLLNFLNNKFKLKGLKIIPELNGYTFKDLPKDLQKKYKNYTLNSRLVKYDDDSEYKFMVFERLNTGSKKLTKQEIRNCIYRGKLLDLAKELSEVPIIKDFYKLAGLTDVRYERIEFILRTMSISEDFPSIKGSASSQINDYMIRSFDFNDDDFIKLKQKYINTIKCLVEYIGYKALLNKKNEITKVNIEALFINIYKYFPRIQIIDNADELKKVINDTINNSEFGVFTDKGTDNRSVIIGKTMLINNAMGNIIEKELPSDKRRCFYLNERIKLWSESLKRRKIVCPICKQEILKFDDCEVDHIVPYSKGGLTSLDNAQLVHSSCNKIKSNYSLNL